MWILQMQSSVKRSKEIYFLLNPLWSQHILKTVSVNSFPFPEMPLFSMPIPLDPAYCPSKLV